MKHQNSKAVEVTVDDAALIRGALKKQRAGESLSQVEKAALRRQSRANENANRERIYRSVPKKHFAAMTGRAQKILNEQAVSHGLPIGGPVVDLYAALRAYHDLLARHKHRLTPAAVAAVGGDDDPLLAGASSPSLEEYRKWRSRNERLTHEKRSGQLIDREEVHAILGRIAVRLRQLGDTMQRTFGADALEMLNEAIDDIARVEAGGGNA